MLGYIDIGMIRASTLVIFTMFVYQLPCSISHIHCALFCSGYLSFIARCLWFYRQFSCCVIASDVSRWKITLPHDLSPDKWSLVLNRYTHDEYIHFHIIYTISHYPTARTIDKVSPLYIYCTALSARRLLNLYPIGWPLNNYHQFMPTAQIATQRRPTKFIVVLKSKITSVWLSQAIRAVWISSDLYNVTTPGVIWLFKYICAAKVTPGR